jgi:hypothetical protein
MLDSEECDQQCIILVKRVGTHSPGLDINILGRDSITCLFYAPTFVVSNVDRIT